MSAVAALPAGVAPPGSPGTGGAVSLLLRRAFLGLVLGLAIGASFFAAALPLIFDADASVWASLRSIVLRSGLKFALLLFLFTGVMLLTTTPIGRAAGFILAIVVVIEATVAPLPVPGFFEERGFDGYRTWVYMNWVIWAFGILTASYLVAWERAQRSEGALREAQLARQRAEHEVLESRLNVLRARVDPEFLFEALGAARRLYAADREAGERLLDALIQYLRAILPQSRDQASSLAEEVHMAATYLELRAAVTGSRVELEAEVAEAFADAFFPPRVLMPIVERAARRSRPDGPRIRVRAVLGGGLARVEVADNAVTRDDDGPTLHDAGLTLRAFFGPGTRVHSEATAEGRVVVLEYPCAGPGDGKDSP